MVVVWLLAAMVGIPLLLAVSLNITSRGKRSKY